MYILNKMDVKCILFVNVLYEVKYSKKGGINMKVVGLVVEYNFFYNGYCYYVE